MSQTAQDLLGRLTADEATMDTALAQLAQGYSALQGQVQQLQQQLQNATSGLVSVDQLAPVVAAMDAEVARAQGILAPPAASTDGSSAAASSSSAAPSAPDASQAQAPATIGG